MKKSDRARDRCTQAVLTPGFPLYIINARRCLLNEWEILTGYTWMEIDRRIVGPKSCGGESMTRWTDGPDGVQWTEELCTDRDSRLTDVERVCRVPAHYATSWS